MSYKVYLNNKLFFDTSLQDQDIILTRAIVEISANGSGSFNFTIPPQHKDYDSLNRLVDLVDVYRDDELLWSGRIYSITTRRDLQKDVSCEGMLTVLTDSIFRPITFQGTLQDLVVDLLNSHNSQVENRKKIQLGRFTVENANVYREYKNYETSMSRLKDLHDSFGGYLMLRKTNGVLYLDWLHQFTDPCTQRIQLTSNLVDIKKVLNSNDVCTMLLPLGAKDDSGERITIKSVNSGVDYITASSEALATYGYIMQTHIWDDVTTPVQLMAKANLYLQAALLPRTEITLTAVDLADAGYDMDSFRVGMMITVYSEPHGLTGQQFACTKQRLNLLDPSQNKLELGEIRIGYIQANRSSSAEQILEKTAQDIARSQDFLQQRFEESTALITGNSGGYVVMHDSDNDTLPDEILVMDTPDIDTAVKVWRWNNAGLGYSSSGYGGPYGLAMHDGMIVADYIQTGTLNGNLLRAGVIRGQQGNSYWDLNTGVLHIEGTGDIDKSKVFIYEPTPPYYVGDLWVTQRDDSSGVVGYMVAGYGVVGNTASGEGGKIMTCIYTRTSGDFDESDWSLITNYVSDNDLQILEQRVSAAELHIDANTASIQSKASMEVTDYLGNRIEAAESTITQQAEQIELKVSESDITGNYLVSKINLSSTTATIQASHIDLQGAVTISSFDSATQGKVVTGSTSKNQYYLSNSADSLTGGSWQNTVTWASGKYIWTRIATTKTYADNTTSTSYSDAIYDSNLTTALSTANTAKNTANASLGAVVSVYYRSTSSTTPTISTSTSIGTAVDTSNAWEYVLPRPKNGCYFFTCERYTDKAGNVTFSAVRQMANTTYTSLWCSANNSSYIDGGHIYAGSITTGALAANAVTAAKIATGAVTADKISVTDLQAIGATIGGWEIASSSIHTNGAAVTSYAEGSVALSHADFTRNLCVANSSGVLSYSDISNLRFAIGRNFGIQKNGTLYCYNAKIGGATIGGASFNSAYINNGTIGGWIVTNTSADHNFKYTGTFQGTLTGTTTLAHGAITLTRTYNVTSGGTTSQRTNQAKLDSVYGLTLKDLDIKTSTQSANGFTADAAGNVYYTTLNQRSDRRTKDGVKELDAEKSADFLYKVQPVSYHFKDIDPKIIHHGFIAQNIESISYDNDWGIVAEYDGLKSLGYTELIADIVATLQLQHREIEALKKEVASGI